MAPKALYGNYLLTGVTKNDPYEIDDTEIWEKLNDHHHTEYFKEGWALNGDGQILIKMKVDLPQEDIDTLVFKGAKPLPLKEPTDTSIWGEETNMWLERISGIKGATNGVYFYEPAHQEPHESEFLIYDRDSQTLYYRLSIM